MPNVLTSACGDGSIQLWNVDTNIIHSYNSGNYKPKLCYREHSKEVCCVDWNHFAQNPLFMSSSWDCSIKLWNPDYMMSFKTYADHSNIVYESKFAKKTANIFASVSADGYLKIWDILQPQPITSIVAHNEAEVYFEIIV